MRTGCNVLFIAIDEIADTLRITPFDNAVLCQGRERFSINVTGTWYGPQSARGCKHVATDTVVATMYLNNDSSGTKTLPKVGSYQLRVGRRKRHPFSYLR